MPSDSSKSAFKMATEDPQQNIAKKYKKKNMKLPGFFSDLWGLNYQSYQEWEGNHFSSSVHRSRVATVAAGNRR